MDVIRWLGLASAAVISIAPAVAADDLALEIGSPTTHADRLEAAELAAIGLDTAGRARLDAVAPVLEAIEAAPGGLVVTTSDRVAAVRAALDRGTEAGLATLADAYTRRVTWVPAFVDELVAAPDASGRVRLLAAARETHGEDDRLRSLERLLTALPPIAGPAPRLRTLLERALSEDPPTRAAIVALAAGPELDLELVASGLMPREDAIRRRAPDLVEVTWFVCEGENSWRARPRSDKDAGIRAARVADPRFVRIAECADARVPAYEPGWTVRVDGVPIAASAALSGTLLEGALPTCHTERVVVGWSHAECARRGVPVDHGECAITERLPIRPDECIDRDDAERLVEGVTTAWVAKLEGGEPL